MKETGKRLSVEQSGRAPEAYDLLKHLGSGLNANLVVATDALNSAKSEVQRLTHSTRMVDNMISILTPGTLSEQGRLSFNANFLTTGQMLVNISDTYVRAAIGPEREFLSITIENALTTAASASLSAFSAQDLEKAKPVEEDLKNHSEEIIGLEKRAEQRLASYGEFLAVILQGAVSSYRDASNPLRFSNASTALRELTREYLEVVAANASVKMARWFVPDTTSKSGVTRRHRIRYAIFGELPDDLFPQLFVTNSMSLADGLVRDIEELSKMTHVTEEVLGTTEAHAGSIMSSLLQRLLLLIDAVEIGKMLASGRLEQIIQESLDRLFVDEFFDELDQLSTHTRPEGAEDVEVTVTGIDEEWITFTGSGSIPCNLQYGSDSDVERGDGLTHSMNFPFTFEGKCPTADPDSVDVDRASIHIDTSRFYE